jgi:predicted MFS family arabinose efflux permease
VPSVARTAWVGPAAAIVVVGWGANMFASLLQVYRGRLSELQVDGLFGAYALGLIPALLVMARLSDRLGRRRVLLAALVVSVLGSAVILVSGGAFGTILFGRVLVGVSAGAAFGPGTAWIKELSDAARAPGAGARRAAVALTAGFAAGPFLSGALVQWAPAPEITSYLVHIGLVGLVVPFLRNTPETGGRATAASPTRRDPADRGLRTVLTGRVFLTAVLPTAPWVFGTATVSLAALPVLVPLGEYGPVGSGTMAAVTLGTGILVQPWARHLARRSPAAPFRAGLSAAVAGLLLAALTVTTGALLLLPVAAVALGTAYGLLLMSGLRLMETLAPTEDAATAIAVFYALTYLGFAFPVLVQTLGTWVAPASVLIAGSGLALIAMLTTFMAWPTARTPRAER